MFAFLIDKAGGAIASIWGKVIIGMAVFAFVTAVVMSYNHAITKNASLQVENQTLNDVIKNKEQQITILQEDKKIIAQISSQQAAELAAANDQLNQLETRLSARSDGDQSASPYIKEVFRGLKGKTKK